MGKHHKKRADEQLTTIADTIGVLDQTPRQRQIDDTQEILVLVSSMTLVGMVLLSLIISTAGYWGWLL